MLGAIESLMSAVVADRMSGDRHNPNVELIAQGIANIASPLFGGLPATGAIARTATNIRSGAQTPVAGMIHALTLLADPAVRRAARALHPAGGAGRRSCWSSPTTWASGARFRELLKLTKMDISVWLVTFALTVFADLTVAVEVGMILAMLLFIRKVSQTTTVSQVTPDYVEAGRRPHPAGQGHSRLRHRLPHPRAVSVRRDRQDRAASSTTSTSLPPIVILRLRNMTAIDATGLRALEDLADRLHRSGRELILCGARRSRRR